MTARSRKRSSRREGETVSRGSASSADEHIISALTSQLGRSDTIQAVLDDAMRFAHHPVNIIICGEAGTHKELVAHAVHNVSPRADKSFVAVDCRTFSQASVEKEFFGHEDMETPDTAGVFSAHGGTLFLDNLEKLPQSSQQLLLAVVRPQNKSSAGLDVRIIAAACSHFERMVEMGLFSAALREALRPRMITIPPLRERPEDILAVAERFRDQANIELRKSIRTFDTETQRVLLEHSWPGNYPELWNVIYRAAFAADNTVAPEDLKHLLINERTTTSSHVSERLLEKIIRAQTRAFGRIALNSRPKGGAKKLSLASRLLGFTRRKTRPESPAEEK